ncbi:SLATT domain-containing protein [Faecalibacterium prausnitzii]|uniref:SLATT domain-containing protein n=1 Tax=Faecalibacterium prausnitzii TaxID=853 RepID=UPI003F1DE48D
MSDNTNEYQVLLDVVRQNYASVVWTHKIQIKQADIYATRYRHLENINVILAAATSCGAVSIFADQDSFVLKIATVILSFITTAVTTYLKCFDLKAMEKQHKDAAEHFLVVRNELLHLIGEIHMQEKSVNELDEKFHGIEETLNALYLSAPSTTDDAVVAASIALGTNKDYTYTNGRYHRYLNRNIHYLISWR